MARNDQPFVTINYNTDQFTEPVFGTTIHDDGLETYYDPITNYTYVKRRIYNGTSASGYISYIIQLIAVFGLAVNVTEGNDTIVATATVKSTPLSWGFESLGVNDGLHRPRPVFGALKHKIQFGKSIQ